MQHSKRWFAPVGMRLGGLAALTSLGLVAAGLLSPTEGSAEFYIILAPVVQALALPALDRSLTGARPSGWVIALAALPGAALVVNFALSQLLSSWTGSAGLGLYGLGLAIFGGGVMLLSQRATGISELISLASLAAGAGYVLGGLTQAFWQFAGIEAGIAVGVMLLVSMMLLWGLTLTWHLLTASADADDLPLATG